MWTEIVASPVRALHALEVVSLDVAAGATGAALLVASLSYGGPFSWALVVGLALALIALAIVVHPEQSREWVALLAVGAVQVVLQRLPLDLVHPVGEWSFAMLGVAALT